MKSTSSASSVAVVAVLVLFRDRRSRASRRDCCLRALVSQDVAAAEDELPTVRESGRLVRPGPPATTTRPPSSSVARGLLPEPRESPHLARPNLPAPARHYPAGVNLTLVPFGEPALRHLMFLERPEGM